MFGRDRIYLGLADTVVKNRIRFSVLCLLILIAALAAASGMKTRLEIGDFLPGMTEVNDAFEAAIRDRSGGAGRIVVYLESEQPMSASEIGPVLDNVAQRLRLVPGVRRVHERGLRDQ